MFLSWVYDIAVLDMRRMGPLALVCNTIVFGLFGLLFTVGAIVSLTKADSLVNVLAAVALFGIGAGLLARIVQGFRYYLRYTRSGREPPPDA